MPRFEIINVVLAIAGIVVSAGGFALTLFQVRKTKSAIEAAQFASKGALRSFSGRLSLSELGDMRSGVRAIQTALRGGRFETALLQTQSLVEQLSSLRTRPGFDDESKHVRIQTIVTQLVKLRNRLEQRIDDNLVTISIPKANNMLSELAETLSGWSEEYRFQIQKGES